VGRVVLYTVLEVVGVRWFNYKSFVQKIVRVNEIVGKAIFITLLHGEYKIQHILSNGGMVVLNLLKLIVQQSTLSCMLYHFTHVGILLLANFSSNTMPFSDHALHPIARTDNPGEYCMFSSFGGDECYNLNQFPIPLTSFPWSCSSRS
jgi:hypothetical protein